ncbi:hypothetical protein AMD26_016860 [Deinococcus sp. UR1]|nr:hypothetical protein AMD26_016860 [Deinococcus sp. UR1]
MEEHRTTSEEVRASEALAQGNTGVRSEHQAHRLGRWLKAANIRERQRLNPHTTEIRTQSADSNGAMLKINSD